MENVVVIPMRLAVIMMAVYVATIAVESASKAPQNSMVTSPILILKYTPSNVYLVHVSQHHRKTLYLGLKYKYFLS